MPSKNEVKIYKADGIYHIYNRGVEKRKIFQNTEDHCVFLNYLKNYLLPKNIEKLKQELINPNLKYLEKEQVVKLLRLNNFSDEITLMAYVLMPNHFHLLVHQKSEFNINKFMNSLITRYSMYFNKKYKRVGPLFQGLYKAVLVNSDEQLLHLSRYIHLQAVFNSKGKLMDKPFPSSYPNYLKNQNQEWINTQRIISYFNNSASSENNYQKFVEDYNSNNGELLEEIKLDP